MKDGFEIERKFLIEFPDEELLAAIDGVKVMKMEQSYIEGGGRVRKIAENSKVTYIKTVKKHITDIKREEKEWEITEEEYKMELENIVEGTKTISKTRYALPLYGFVYEIDVFPFWRDRAFLEVELESEDQQFPIPDFIKVIKEVTSDKRYRNSSLAIKIVTEPII